jgi:hypothetical protein
MFSPKGRRARCVFHLGIELGGHCIAQRRSKRLCLAQDATQDTSFQACSVQSGVVITYRDAIQEPRAE